MLLLVSSNGFPVFSNCEKHKNYVYCIRVDSKLGTLQVCNRNEIFYHFGKPPGWKITTPCDSTYTVFINAYKQIYLRSLLFLKLSEIYHSLIFCPFFCLCDKNIQRIFHICQGIIVIFTKLYKYLYCFVIFFKD